MTAPEPLLSGATGRITIDLAALGANWRALAALVAPARCAAVVKADAYGLGADRVVPALIAAGAQVLFVATPAEAVVARRLAPVAELYVLDGLMPGVGPVLASIAARPVLSSLPEVTEWAEVCRAAGVRLPAALHVDSGLNRLGLTQADVARLAAAPELLTAFETSLVMSHLACADEPEHPKNALQLAAFRSLSDSLPGAPRSLAASDGLMLGADYRFDLVRPGYALYGGQATRGRPAPVAPVVTVEARVLQVKDVAAGATVGYAASWQAGRASRIAIVAAGYADGLSRGASAATGEDMGQVVFRGRRAPLIGRVSMDLIAVDVTDLGDAAPARGDLVTLVGDGLTLEESGARHRTIGYEILTRLGRRFERGYTEGHG